MLHTSASTTINMKTFSHVLIAFLYLTNFSIASTSPPAPHHHSNPNQQVVPNSAVDFNNNSTLQNDPDPVPFSTREHWMRRARSALLEITGTPCPFGAFGTAIVNHTGRAEHELGELVCIGANAVASTGNPNLHGEIAAINNCTTVLRAPPYSLSPSETLAAFEDLTLYTTAEACSMCATAIAWAGFREYVYATSLWRLIDLNWASTHIGSREVLARGPQADRIRIVGGVLQAETDELFAWQFDDGSCPVGCVRGPDDAECVYHPA